MDTRGRVRNNDTILLYIIIHLRQNRIVTKAENTKNNGDHNNHLTNWEPNGISNNNREHESPSKKRYHFRPGHEARQRRQRPSRGWWPLPASSGDGDPQEVQWGASSGSIDDLQAWLEVGSCNKSGTRQDACKLAEHDDGVKWDPSGGLGDSDLGSVWGKWWLGLGGRTNSVHYPEKEHTNIHTYFQTLTYC